MKPALELGEAVLNRRWLLEPLRFHQDLKRPPETVHDKGAVAIHPAVSRIDSPPAAQLRKAAGGGFLQSKKALLAVVWMIAGVRAPHEKLNIPGAINPPTDPTLVPAGFHRDEVQTVHALRPQPDPGRSNQLLITNRL